MSVSDDDDVDLKSLTETAEALSRYAELVEQFGLGSPQAKHFLQERQHLPQFAELAAETNRLESQFQKTGSAVAYQSREKLVPPSATSRWGAVAALAMILLLAGGGFLALSQSQKNGTELRQLQLGHESFGEAVITALNKDFVSNSKDPSAIGPIAGLEDRQKAGETTAGLKKQVQKNVDFFVDLASKKTDPKFAMETMEVICSVGKEIPAGDAAGYKILDGIDKLVSAYPDHEEIKSKGGIAVKNLQALFPKKH